MENQNDIANLNNLMITIVANQLNEITTKLDNMKSLVECLSPDTQDHFATVMAALETVTASFQRFTFLVAKMGGEQASLERLIDALAQRVKTELDLHQH